MGVTYLGKMKLHELAKELNLTSKEVVEKALGMFSEIHIVIAVNPEKKCMFSQDIREEIIRQTFKNNQKIKEYLSNHSTYGSDGFFTSGRPDSQSGGRDCSLYRHGKQERDSDFHD